MFDFHLEPTRISVCILTIPWSCNMTCAWPMSRITSSQVPSMCFISNHPQHNDHNVTIPLPSLSASSLPCLSAEDSKCRWHPRRRLTNSRTSRVHRVAQPTLLHQALHVGDLFRDRCGWGTDLIHHESRMSRQGLAPGRFFQLTYWDETEVGNTCLWRLERSGYLSHYCELWQY